MPTNDLIVICGAGFFALFMAWRGWCLGIMRLLLGLAGLAAGYWIGSSSGRIVASKVPFGLLPESAFSVGAGIFLGFGCYILARALAAVLFKRTAQQESTVLRWSYGSLGACLGLAQALAILWLISAGMRFSSEPHDRAASAKKEQQHLALVDTFKKNLQQGALAAVLEAVDPVPPHYYALARSGYKAAQDPQALGRFFASAPAKELSRHPKIQALRSDPGFQNQIRTGNLFELILNPKFIAVVTDSELRQSLLKPETAKALEEATQH